MPRLSRPPLSATPGVTIEHLDRIEHAVVVFEIGEAVPGFAGMQHPALRIGGELLGRRVLEADLLAASCRPAP